MTNFINLNGQFKHGKCAIKKIYLQNKLKSCKKYEQMTQSK